MSDLNLPAQVDRIDGSPSKLSPVILRMAITFAPLMILGYIGEWIGDGTALGAILINLAYILSLLLATALLWSGGSGWRQIGMARPKSWPRTILLGVAAVILAIAAGVVLQVIVQLLPGINLGAADRSSYDPIVGNLPLLILYLVASWSIIPFGEEMIFRAFLINSLAQLLPDNGRRWSMALVGSAVLFGLAHLSWGLAGVVDTTLMGLVFGYFYLRSGRNLWVTIAGHTLINTLGFIQIYLGMAG